jgi:hypothetical protein
MDIQGTRGNSRKLTSFIGGLDLCDGQWDMPTHSMFATLQTLHKNDYHNPAFTVSFLSPRSLCRCGSCPSFLFLGKHKIPLWGLIKKDAKRNQWEKGRGRSSSKSQGKKKKKLSIPQQRKDLQQLFVYRHHCRYRRAIAWALVHSLVRSICFICSPPLLLRFAGIQPRPTTMCTPLNRPIGRIHYIV